MATIERLTKRPDFLAAVEGRRFHTERMTAQGRLRGTGPRDVLVPEGLRLGFTITKRVGKATERNRIRRRLRAALSQVAADLPADLATVCADIVLIARRPALDADFSVLAEDLRRAIPTVTRPRAPGDPRGGDRPKRKSGGRSGPAPSRGGADLGPSPPRAKDHRPDAAPGSDRTRDGSIATPNTCGGVPDGQ